MIEFYKQFDIQLKLPAHIEALGSQSQDARSQTNDAFSHSEFNPQMNMSCNATNASSDDIQIVDRYLVRRKKAWPLSKFVHVFKENHAKRFSNRKLAESSQERSAVSSQILTDPEIKRNKSLQKILPHDNRKYKDDAISHLINNYTFSPRMSTKSNQLAHQYHAKQQL